ncbi:MAG TPA: NUDIX domain-containing protein, partial [Anaerolineae bacterium]|nr:NUDIX domain-containing protein [Anaerolineae bacterium]
MTRDLDIHAFCVSVYVLRPDPREGWRILLLRRAGEHLPGLWSQVAGGIESGERGWQAALRELAEETGLVPLDFFSGDI